jgi:ketosteroid isomerase-like protein
VSDDVLAAVGQAADRLVSAFGSHDRNGYFAAFDPGATFLFYTAPSLLASRAAYEAEWLSWETEGFHVDECVTSDRRIDVLSEDVAVLTHRVRTRVSGSGDVLRERETIVFRRGAQGHWLAVHEHLSPDPSEDA